MITTDTAFREKTEDLKPGVIPMLSLLTGGLWLGQVYLEISFETLSDFQQSKTSLRGSKLANPWIVRRWVRVTINLRTRHS